MRSPTPAAARCPRVDRNPAAQILLEQLVELVGPGGASAEAHAEAPVGFHAAAVGTSEYEHAVVRDAQADAPFVDEPMMERA